MEPVSQSCADQQDAVHVIARLKESESTPARLSSNFARNTAHAQPQSRDGSQHANFDAPVQQSPSPSLSNSSLVETSRYLYHHYVKIVGHQHHPYPWENAVPAAALQNDTLRHAVLSLAAAHLPHLGDSRRMVQVKVWTHRAAARRALSGDVKRLCAEDIGCILAAITGIYFAEAYMGESSEEWIYHARAFFSMLEKVVEQEPWTRYRLASLYLQRLCLIRLRAQVDGEDREPYLVNPTKWNLALKCFGTQTDTLRTLGIPRNLRGA